MILMRCAARLGSKLAPGLMALQLIGSLSLSLAPVSEPIGSSNLSTLNSQLSTLNLQGSLIMDFITQEELDRPSLVLNQWVNALDATTSEIDELINQIKNNIMQLHDAFERQDIDAYHSLNNINSDLFGKLDWLIVNL